MLTRGAEAWIARLEATDVPCGRINNYEQVFQDPQVQYRGLRVDMPKAGGGVISTIASPLRLCGTPVKYALPPPAVGDSTDYVLGQLLGYGPQDIQALKEKKVV